MTVLRRVFPVFYFMLIPLSGILAQERTVTYYQDPSSNPPDLPVDLKHIKAEVTFRPEENLVRSHVELTMVFRRHQADSFSIYAPDFRISDIRIKSREREGTPPVDIRFRHKISGKYLVVYPFAGQIKKGSEYVMGMNYEVNPGSGAIYFIGWKPEEAGKRRQIWAHRPHGWLPYIDARIRMDMHYTFDSSFRVFANGDRVSVTRNPDHTLTWHYSMKKDHPFFSTSLAIGDYNYLTDTTEGGVPLEYWYYEGMASRVPVTYKYTSGMFRFFEMEMGYPYPYSVYRQAPVIDYMYGAMETTTATVFGDYMFIDPGAWWQRNYVNVNAHELAHQWFGDCVAHLVNQDVWLTESFGTYYAKIFERHVFGEDYYQGVRNEEQLLALDAARRNNLPVGGSQGGVPRIYQKGSLVLDMLRDVMGDQAFKDAIQLYLQRFAFNYAQTNDLLRCIWDVTGQSYKWFFDQWILKGGEPHFQVQYQQAEDTVRNRYTRIRVEQIHETGNLTGTFRMPAGFEVWYTDRSKDSAVAWLEGKYSEVSIPNPAKKKVAFVLFDPGRKILKKVTFHRSQRELFAQLSMARNMIDRYDALLELKTVPLSVKRQHLVDAWRRESFHLMKSEIIRQMSDDNTPEAVDIFRLGLKDKDALVRRTVLQEVVPLPYHIMEAGERCLSDSSYHNIELALENLTRSFPENDSLYLDLTAGMEGWRGKNIRMKWLEIQLKKGNSDYLPELVRYTGPEYEFETRINAFDVLREIRFVNEVTALHAVNAAKHWNNKLSAAARDYLNYFGISGI